MSLRPGAQGAVEWPLPSSAPFPDAPAPAAATCWGRGKGTLGRARGCQGARRGGHRFLPQHGGSGDSRLWPPCRGPFQRRRGWFSPEHRRPRLWPGGCGLVGRDEVGPIVPTGLTATVFARTLPQAAKGNGAIRTSALVPVPAGDHCAGNPTADPPMRLMASNTTPAPRQEWKMGRTPGETKPPLPWSSERDKPRRTTFACSPLTTPPVKIGSVSKLTRT